MQLSGGCACGRNVYVIEIPADTDEQAQILLDNSSSTRTQLASPFTAWLRIPLSWYRSLTIAFYPDETHRLIRRVFVSPHAQGVLRHFCGFCGTPLSRYVMEEREEGAVEAVEVTLGSLVEEDAEMLVGMGGLGAGDDEEEEEEDVHEDRIEAGMVRGPFTERVRPAQHRGAGWFESLVGDARLGRLKRHRGGWEEKGERVEWEVVEYLEEEEEEEAEGEGGERRESVKRRRVEVVVEDPVEA